ncbi:MAG: altronate dehydratase family protein [Anaerolineae bacterium]|nr:altronate dehydratase family protein [Anaerolineae bacterium]
MTTTNHESVSAYIAPGVPLHTIAIRLNPQDNVAIAKRDIEPESRLIVGEEKDTGLPCMITVRQRIPSGHKIALQAIPVGDPVRRYGQAIGFASETIDPGMHVHMHNVGVHDFDRDYAFGVDAKPVDYLPEDERREFMGYRRPDGRVGTRNYIAVISTVNCSAHVARGIAHHFTAERLADFPNVDGVIPIIHGYGCSIPIGGTDYAFIQRALAGIARHANVAAYVLVGLGCENNQIKALVENCRLEGVNGMLAGNAPQLVIQELGGIRKTIAAGIDTVGEMLPLVGAAQRVHVPISELCVALQCGGSDSWSGVTANPVVGLVADEIVRSGGTVLLGETPEIYGAEHLLTRRVISQDIGSKLVRQIKWWEQHARRMGMEINNNPSPGNKVGGLTTIHEKSLGAVAKAGCTPLIDVYDYAEPVSTRGFNFMNTPGNDWTAIAGQVAGGCTLILFTTGRGSVFGFKPSPVIKIASNSTMYHHMVDDMDLNAGRVLEGETLCDVANDLLDTTIAIASGLPSKSEAQGLGESEFSPWHLGSTL